MDRARSIFERFVYVHPDVKNWIKYAKFEERHGYIIGSRRVYERAVDFFGDDHMDEKLFIAFAKFEEGQKEHERATAIYKFALEHMSKDKAADLYKAYTIHQKKFGERDAIEDVIVSKRKFQYEEEIKENPSNYDAWFDYLRLLESEGIPDCVVLIIYCECKSYLYRGRQCGRGARHVRKGYRQCPACGGEILLASLHLSMDQLRSL